MRSTFLVSLGQPIYGTYAWYEANHLPVESACLSGRQGSPVDAMRINFGNPRKIIRQLASL